jgi:AraC-like DNA-binding protein
VRRSSIDDITLSINTGAAGRLEQDGRGLITSAGTGNFYSSTQPMRLFAPAQADRADSYDKLMIQVDRGQLRRRTGFDLPLGTQVPTGHVGLGLLSETASRLLVIADSLSSEEREHYSRAVLDLLAAVVLSCRSGRRVTPSGPEALFEQLKADVFARLDDPDLGPTDLAARHSISLRYVHRLFGAEAPAAFIRRHRMLAAADLVSRTSPHPLPVASIAVRCGFRDVGTFVRAFRRYYGCTPTDYRRLPLEAQT